MFSLGCRRLIVGGWWKRYLQRDSDTIDRSLAIPHGNALIRVRGVLEQLHHDGGELILHGRRIVCHDSLVTLKELEIRGVVRQRMESVMITVWRYLGQISL